MEVFVDGKQKTLGKGDISVALSFVPHAYKTPVHSRSSIVFIPAKFCEEFSEMTEGKRLVTPFISEPDTYKELEHFFTLLNENEISEIKRRGIIYMILGTISEAIKLEDIYNPTDAELVSKILLYINENYKDDISPSKIAKHLGYSQSHISRYFKSCCGINPVRYIGLVRLRQAVMLMHEGHHSITDCILESGFSSHTSFYRTFKNEFGCSPKEYMKNNCN